MSRSVVRLTVPAQRPRRRAEDRATGHPPVLAGTVAGDRVLVRAAAVGDAGAWAQLVDAYLPAVWQWVLDEGELGASARTVNEVVWLRLAQSLPEHGRALLAPWLHEVVVQECRRGRSRRGRSPQ